MVQFFYDRNKAVEYAETWWDSYHPDFPRFPVNCTNFVSQCLFAGGAPMWGAPDRTKGWWCYPDNWSYSWSVSHSFYWYLKGSTTGLRAIEVSSPKELYPGDVICYDFQGDNRWDHTTFVVAKDIYGFPLVNAQTDNSYHRNWMYMDSAAWTPRIKYAFFHIINSDE